MEPEQSYETWCRDNNCDHGHCPDACEHPQPFFLDGKLVCGRCFFRFNEISEMVPCRPETCEEAARP